MPEGPAITDWMAVGTGIAALIAAIYFASRQTSILKKQADMQKIQSDLQARQTDLMKLQADISGKQTVIQERQADIDAKKREYNLLKEEMDKLVAPLFIAYLSTQAKGSWGFFQPLDPRDRWAREAENRFRLWDGIKSNMHLSQSEELRASLGKYFFANDNYYIFNKEKFVVRDFERAKMRLLLAIKKRHPDLERKIICAEIELGIRKKGKNESTLVTDGL
jgi:hypothetical protein